MTNVFSMDWLGLGVDDHALQATSKGIKRLHAPEGSPSALEPYNTTMKETEPMDMDFSNFQFCDNAEQIRELYGEQAYQLAERAVENRSINTDKLVESMREIAKSVAILKD